MWFLVPSSLTKCPKSVPPIFGVLEARILKWFEEKGVTEDEMSGWHHQLNGHDFERTLGDGEGQGSLACCGPWGHKE